MIKILNIKRNGMQVALLIENFLSLIIYVLI